VQGLATCITDFWHDEFELIMAPWLVAGKLEEYGSSQEKD
jgi:hypothetical protein